MTVVVSLLGGAGLLGTAVFTLAVFGVGDSRSGGFEMLYVCLHLLPGAICLLRAALVPRERIVWGLIGPGMVSRLCRAKAERRNRVLAVGPA